MGRLQAPHSQRSACFQKHEGFRRPWKMCDETPYQPPHDANDRRSCRGRRGRRTSRCAIHRYSRCGHIRGQRGYPEGHVEIYLEDPAIQDKARRRGTQTRIKSDGRSKSIAFTLSLPASTTASPTRRIVARLERADGWLVARGSTQLEAGTPVYLTLNAVIY